MVNYNKLPGTKRNEKCKEALELCKEILDDITDLPERAENFAASVEEKVTSIQIWIEDNSHVTDKQIEALENMSCGVKKWFS